MPIVPTEADLLDRFIELEDEARRRASRCGGSTGGDDPDGPTDDDLLPEEEEVPPEEVPPSEESKPIKLRAGCNKDPEGNVQYPDGTPWPFNGGAGTLEGSGIVDGVPAKVRINAQFKWDPQASDDESTAKDENTTRTVGQPRSLMFKLPPGWWPRQTITKRVPVSGGGGSVEITAGEGHVYFRPSGKIRPTNVDLRGIMYDAGGGSETQGDGTMDPTGGGCGEAWDGGENFPEMISDALGGALGGMVGLAATISLEGLIIPFHEGASGWQSFDGFAYDSYGGNAHRDGREPMWRRTPLGIQLKGELSAPDAYTAQGGIISAGFDVGAANPVELRDNDFLALAYASRVVDEIGGQDQAPGYTRLTYSGIAGLTEISLHSWAA